MTTKNSRLWVHENIIQFILTFKYFEIHEVIIISKFFNILNKMEGDNNESNARINITNVYNKVDVNVINVQNNMSM